MLLKIGIWAWNSRKRSSLSFRFVVITNVFHVVEITWNWSMQEETEGWKFGVHQHTKQQFLRPSWLTEPWGRGLLQIQNPRSPEISSLRPENCIFFFFFLFAKLTGNFEAGEWARALGNTDPKTRSPWRTQVGGKWQSQAGSKRTSETICINTRAHCDTSVNMHPGCILTSPGEL